MATRLPTSNNTNTIYPRGSVNPVVFDINKSQIGSEYSFSAANVVKPRGDSAETTKYREGVNATRKRELYEKINAGIDADKNAGLRIIDIGTHVSYLKTKYLEYGNQEQYELDAMSKTYSAVFSAVRFAGVIGAALSSIAKLALNVGNNNFQKSLKAGNEERIRLINLDAVLLKKEVDLLTLEYDLNGVEANKKLAAAIENENNRSANLTENEKLTVGVIFSIIALYILKKFKNRKAKK